MRPRRLFSFGDATVGQEEVFMTTASRPVPSSSGHEDKRPPAALFQTSLRDWQARYKVRRAIAALASEKLDDQTVPALMGRPVD
jgi:hypothetical protein